jgi:RHS repeat-associated protein
VYFDDVQLDYGPALLVQESHYDPTGLNLAGIERAQGIKPLNQYQFNGKEKQVDLGLNWNDHGWRFYDPQLGRWHVVDPEAESGDQESWSTYQFGFNNAIRYNDLDGRVGKEGEDKKKSEQKVVVSPEKQNIIVNPDPKSPSEDPGLIALYAWNEKGSPPELPGSVVESTSNTSTTMESKGYTATTKTREVTYNLQKNRKQKDQVVEVKNTVRTVKSSMESNGKIKLTVTSSSTTKQMPYAKAPVSHAYRNEVTKQHEAFNAGPVKAAGAAFESMEKAGTKLSEAVIKEATRD